ncbi:MarR family winged helix-turn-helix transcriptional regulator [Propionibacteriaceae bacterium Y1685]
MTDGVTDLGELLHGAFRGLRRSWSEQLAPYGLTPHQWRGLHTLHRIGTPVRLRELAERLHIAPRSATEVVDQLVERDLVTRAADSTDRRAILVELTDSGQDLVARIRAARRERADVFFGTLGRAEQKELGKLLQRLVDQD